MCLEKIDYKKTAEFRDLIDPIIVWKTLNLLDGDLVSPFFNLKPWHPGINQSNRENVEITPQEQGEDEIEEGFHFFLEKHDCIGYTQNLILFDNQNAHVCKFSVAPKDIVAVGCFQRWTCLNLVAIKASFIGMMEEN